VGYIEEKYIADGKTWTIMGIEVIANRN